jgi:hypothetical protein
MALEPGGIGFGVACQKQRVVQILNSAKARKVLLWDR